MIHFPAIKRGGVFFPLLTAIICMAFIACGNEGASQVNPSDTGAISFKMAWSNPAYPNVNRQSPGDSVCEDYDIDTIHITVEVPNDDGGYYEPISKDYACSDHRASIGEIPATSGIRLTIVGVVSGSNDWRYENENITVPRGRTENLGLLEMGYTGGDQSPPEVSAVNGLRTPGGVLLNPTIQLRFEEQLVANSVDSRSCILTDAETGEAIPIAVNYTYYDDLSMGEITIEPVQSLRENSRYQVTVFGLCPTDPPSCCQPEGRCIEDKAARILAQNFAETFITRTGPPPALVWGQGNWNEAVWN